MNGYNLLRNWYNFKFSNPSKTKASHSDMYCYLVDLWNRLGQKEEFGLPTQVTMEALGIGSYNTYRKTMNDLIDFGFIILISESKNQHQSRIVALSNFDKATDKALDKAHNKATDKALDTINKQRTINKNNKENIEERKQKFAFSLQPFVEKYGREFIKEFYLYWSEPTLDNKKLKYELEKTWSLERRLIKWESNAKKFGTTLPIQEQTKFKAPWQ